jgi:hypothetical protein
MSLPTFNTWDGDPTNGVAPYLPGTADFGGDDLENDADYPPIAGQTPDADGWNQFVKQLVSLGRTTAMAKIEIHFDVSTGTPFVFAVVAMGNAVTTASFTITDNGNGDTTIAWPAGTFPAALVAPTGLTFLGGSGDAAPTQPTGQVEVISATSIRVRTRDVGDRTDIPFTVCL